MVRVWLTTLALWLATSLLSACVADTDDGGFARGSVTAQLTLDESAGVRTIVYTLSGGPLGSPLQGSFEPSSGPPFHWAISNLPAGNGYTVDISGYDETGNEVCAGTTEFEVLASDSTFLNIVLICGLAPSDPVGRVDLRVKLEQIAREPCPMLHSVNVVPARIEIGGSAQIEVVASDPGGKPLSYTWTASAGSFEDTSLSQTVYSCDAARGPHKVSVVVDNGDPACVTIGELAVDCAG